MPPTPEEASGLPPCPGSPSQERSWREGKRGRCRLRRTRAHGRLAPAAKRSVGTPTHRPPLHPEACNWTASQVNKQLPGPCPCPGTEPADTLGPGLEPDPRHSGLRPEPEAQLQVGPPASTALLGSRRPQERKAASPQEESASHADQSQLSPRLHTQGPVPWPTGKTPCLTVCEMQVLDKYLKVSI